jgi:hypothetical protein
MSVKLSRPNHHRCFPPTCESRGGRRLSPAPSDTSPWTGFARFTAQTLPSLMIARALRDSRRPVSSPKPSSHAQVRA